MVYSGSDADRFDDLVEARRVDEVEAAELLGASRRTGRR